MNRKTWFHLAVLPVFALLAVGSSSPKKDGAADDKASTTTTTAGKLGSAITVGDAEWTVLDIVNRGSAMKANESYEKDAATTGSFVQVRFKVTNKSKKEGVMGEIPKLVDATGREFGTFETASSFRPKDTTGVFLDKVQPSMTKEFTENLRGARGRHDRVAEGARLRPLRLRQDDRARHPPARTACPRRPRREGRRRLEAHRGACRREGQGRTREEVSQAAARARRPTSRPRARRDRTRRSGRRLPAGARAKQASSRLRPGSAARRSLPSPYAPSPGTRR